ncbi:MAG TPA: tubulin-like doman-containing protein, partial [Lacipirellulaceae bacterium]|nr:tubulin-like doman-containing protein [Lacipirellulaceae bacterium]
MNAAHDHSGLSLPGYTLSTRLGAGGYGEVWLAHAPGGLTKAVKFIFGSYNERRAEHELRALQKVKEVRHPFLLSLERIEVVDGRLVIVTELADGSLKDRFDQCIRQGLPGIPRDELLGYMRDAADALDYLSHKHSLQHLDVKPENLLMLAGHVKVADFGLVKDVGKSQASLVGGLTPLYSAPEVFQGSPSTHSDQYSLAVLYQEMLTGVLPFDGVTAAELTLQHLNDEPDVGPLPTADRYVVSRALSKEPSQRFASCTELIEALASQEHAAAQQAWTTPDVPFESAPAGRRPGPVTEMFGEELDSRPRDVSSSMLLDVAPYQNTEPVALGPVHVDAEFRPQPTLVIGVGGAAADVLKQLRQRVSRQHGDAGLPAVQMLLFDSDPKTIAHALQGDVRTALKPEETLALPLRRPQEYREQSARLMRWLSRRWLYNIPRSLRTDGVRPLGRLALADHARQAIQRIRMALASASSAESVETSRTRSGLDFEAAAPRVYIVASISGGAGSGMALDVAYAVRAALDKMGAPEAPIVGIFMHAAGGDPRRCDLARVNSFAWLTEYNHFHRPGGAFPGDESYGLPPMPPGRRALDSAYLVDLGLTADEGGPPQAAQSVAEYVY